ncbi:transferrin-binding protein-like solute binding protein [Magnetospirillum molischianum]|uniref:FecR protein domain-containing protein n=1 Tax=Magnetospirillum molischianum DSM 120 TaxID=1150626 RepID=H8FMY3_MAGML|nr:transferrin-binding protein-like solute binding protein [Magnetospirillum molischianum]CCG39721.1 exported hypothetical protein [Magnetospirillum molischianum DSM 120]
MRQASYGVSAALASALALSGPALAADGIPVGTAGGLHGSVQLAAAGFDAERRPVGRQIGSGDPIYQGDLIVTGPGGGLQVMLLDQTIVTLGENARMTIDDIAFNPANGDGKIEFGVEQGTFRFISGQVAQARPDNVNIRVPMGNIGIRGTIVGGVVSPTETLVALLGPGGETDSSARHGAIVVTTPGGSVDISRTGFASQMFFGQPPLPPAPLTPAQLQSLNRAAAAPPQSSSPPPAAGAGVSASAVSGESGAVGGRFVNVVTTGTTFQGAADKRNEASNGAFVTISLAYVPTLADSIGTALTVRPDINIRGLEETCDMTCQSPSAQHDYAEIEYDGFNKSLTYTKAGVTLRSVGSSPVRLNTLTQDALTKIDVYSGSGGTVFYDYHHVDGLLYSTYGYFVETWSNDETRHLVALGTGIPTPRAQMPNSGSATYSGGTVGYLTIGHGQESSATFTGTATLTANFSAGSIGGSLRSLSTTMPDVTMGNIALSNGVIGGNMFGNGVATGTVTHMQSPTDIHGSFSGGFNGPSAKEIAGTYQMNNSTAPNFSDVPMSVVGSFGAKK